MTFSNNDTILVTGATGFTGAHLVNKLCSSGATVHAIARATSNTDKLKHLPIKWFVGDVFDKDVVKSASEGVNYIFHVAAAFREAKVQDTVYSQVHVQSTQLLHDSIAKQVENGLKFKRFVHVSTAGVHGHIENPPADENYRFSTGDNYQATKLQGEALIRELSSTSGIPVTVIRPCAIYGPGDRRLIKLFKMAKLPICPILGFGCKGLYHLIHVEDLTQFMVDAAFDDGAVGEVFIVGNPEATSIQNIIRYISDLFSKNTKFIRIPVSPIMAASWLCEKVCKSMGVEPVIYPRRVAFFTKDRSFDTRKMKKVAKFKYTYSDKEGLKDLASWYEKNGWL